MSARLTRRVLLIGWDAADWQIIHPLMEAGKLPVLQRLVEYGHQRQDFHVAARPFRRSCGTPSPPGKTGGQARHPRLHGTAAGRLAAYGRCAARPGGSRLSGTFSVRMVCVVSVVNWYASHPAEPIAGTVFTNRLTNDALGDGRRPSADAGGGGPSPRTASTPPRTCASIPPRLGLKQLARLLPAVRTCPIVKDPRFGTLAHLPGPVRHHAQRRDLAGRTRRLGPARRVLRRYRPHRTRVHRVPSARHGARERRKTPPFMAEVVNNMYRFHDMMLGTLLDLAGTGRHGDPALGPRFLQRSPASGGAGSTCAIPPGSSARR